MGIDARAHNFAFATLRRAFADPDAIAFAGTSTVTYQRFAELVVHFARKMREFGVDRGSTVGLVVKSPVVTMVAVTAVGLLGARWHSGASRNRPRSVPDPTHVFAGMGESQAGAYEFTKAWFEAPAASLADLEGFAGNAHGDDIWMIAHSSGTTGHPKHMAVSYDVAWQRISGNVDLVDGEPMILASLFEPTGYVGVRPRLANLLAGGTNVNATVFDKMIANNVNRVLGSPAQVATLIRGLQPPDRRIRSCRLTGASVTKVFIERALEFFTEVQVLYGSTEAGVITLARFDDQTPYDQSTGHVLEGVEIDVIDSAGQSVATGEEGVVRVRTGWMVPGYMGEPELTASLFPDGWFEPGDLGFVDGRGALHITGRTGDVINSGGKKFNAAEVDELVQLHPAVEDGYCFVEKDELGADVLSVVVSLRPGTEGLATSDMALGRVDKGLSPRRLYVVDTVLRNENGKPMRAESARSVQGLTPIVLG